MWKFRVLFLVFAFCCVKETNATSVDNTVWTAGSPVDVTFGPEDAVYCKLKDNKHRLIFDGFGPCRVVVDRVTMDHHGYWNLWIGVNGTVIVRNSFVYVDVVAADDSTARVTGSVEGKFSSVVLKCTVPEQYEIMTCTFRDPSGSVFIATRGVNQEGYNNVISYESFVDRHDCTLTLLTPPLERAGIWRCAVNTTQDTRYGFVVLNKSTLDHDYIHDPTYYGKPVLQTTYSSISGMEGDEKTLSCSIDAALRYCYFRAPNGTVFNVDPSTSSAGYQYFGNGFDAGECGIRFNHIWVSDEGVWSCNVGLQTNFEEQRALISVFVNQRLVVNHRWSGNSMIVSLHIIDGPQLEYCRFVRSDGLGFTSENVPPQYDHESGELYGTCALTIPNPTFEDLRPWTIVARVIGEDGEVSMTTTLDSRGQHTRGLSNTAAVLLWSFFGTIFVFLIVVSCLPKENREWTYQRASRIRNSFRIRPQPKSEQQNVTDLSKPPVHTNILTDLPLKF